MTRLLSIILVAVAISFGHYAAAQTAPPTSPTGAPTAAGRPGTPPATHLPTRTPSPRPTFQRIEGSCLEKGQIIRLLGQGFTQASKASVEIKLQPGNLTLPPLSVRDGLITSRVPKTIELRENTPYQFQILLDKRPIPGPGNAIKLSVCDTPGDQSPTVKNDKDYLPAEILIMLPQDTYDANGIGRIRADMVAAGFTILEDVPLEFLESYLLRLRAPDGNNLSDLIEELRANYPEAEIDFNHVSRLANGRKFYAQKLTGLPAPPATCKLPDDNHLKIGVIDGAPDLTHSSLSHRTDIRLARFGDGSPSSPISSAHGTAIAGLFKGDDQQLGIYGLLPNSRLFVADVLGQKTGTANSSSLLKSFNWLIKLRVNIISISMEGPNNRLVAGAISKVRKNGIFIVAAAGNGGFKDKLVYPAAYPSVIAVTAVGPTKSLYGKANKGSFVDIAAPGVGIWAARKGEGASYQSGTSFAVPFAVMKVALILTHYQNHPALSPDQLRIHLSDQALDLGAPGKDPLFGAGLLQIENCQ